MLGAIAAIALIVGTLSATISVTEDDRQSIERHAEPVVEPRVVQGMDSASE